VSELNLSGDFLCSGESAVWSIPEKNEGISETLAASVFPYSMAGSKQRWILGWRSDHGATGDKGIQGWHGAYFSASLTITDCQRYTPGTFYSASFSILA